MAAYHSNFWILPRISKLGHYSIHLFGELFPAKHCQAELLPSVTSWYQFHLLCWVLISLIPTYMLRSTNSLPWTRKPWHIKACIETGLLLAMLDQSLYSLVICGYAKKCLCFHQPFNLYSFQHGLLQNYTLDTIDQIVPDLQLTGTLLFVYSNSLSACLQSICMLGWRLI